jgi:hypothetical protein
MIELCQTALRGFTVEMREIFSRLIHGFYYHIKGDLAAAIEKISEA